MSDYKRLTKRFTGGSPYTEYAGNHEILSRLAELEDKLENGTLIELPCKKGDIVYYIDRYWQSPTIEEYEVYGFVMNDKNELLILVAYGIFCMSQDEIFLTKAEVEAKLEELKRGQK